MNIECLCKRRVLQHVCRHNHGNVRYKESNSTAEFIPISHINESITSILGVVFITVLDICLVFANSKEI